MSVGDEIGRLLNEPEHVSALMGALRTTEAQTRTMIDTALPPVIEHLRAHADGDGLDALQRAAAADGGALVESLPEFLASRATSAEASQLVAGVLGSRRSGIEGTVAATAGCSVSAASRLLPKLVPTVISFLGSLDLDAEGLREQLGADDEGPDDSDDADDDRHGAFVAGLGPASGGLAGLLPAAEPVEPAAADDALLNDRGRRGLAWALPAVAAAIALALGLALWQCSESGIYLPSLDDEETAEPALPAADEEVPAVEVAAEPTPAPTEVPEPEATATPEPEPTPAPTATPTPQPVTIASLALANEQLSSVIGLAVQFDLDGQLADPTAGPFTVFAPTNAAFDQVAGVIDRLDDTQLESTVGFHVVQGLVASDDLVAGAEFRSITGELLRITDDGVLPGGGRVADGDVEAANGIVHVIDGVLVPPIVQRALATEDINALFELEPIQFATGSADILPESIATLDQAIAVLVAVPPETRLEVQGHTDSDGSEEANQALSEARAASVVDYLTNGGVPADLLVPVGYGETRLAVDPELTPEDFAANRRIEFVDTTE